MAEENTARSLQDRSDDDESLGQSSSDIALSESRHSRSLILPQPTESQRHQLDFDELFDSFAKVEDPYSEGISLKSANMWFMQANLFTQDLTTTDTAVLFAKFAKYKKKLTKPEFEQFLKELSLVKNVDFVDLKYRLVASGKPSSRARRESGSSEGLGLADTTRFAGRHAQDKHPGLPGRGNEDNKKGASKKETSDSAQED